MPCPIDVQFRRVMREVKDAQNRNPFLSGYNVLDGGHLLPEVVKKLQDEGLTVTITTKNYVSWAEKQT